MKSIKVNIMRLPHGADLPLPAYQSAGAAGLDLIAAVPADAPVTIAPGARALSRPASRSRCRAAPRRRCGRAPASRRSHGITVLNAPGTIDADYRGEIQVMLVNLGGEPFSVERGMRIAQLVIAPVFRAQLLKAEKLDKTARGAARFRLYRAGGN